MFNFNVPLFIQFGLAGAFIASCVFLLLSHLYNTYKYSKVSLVNKHVVVTGGSSGIGKWMAIEAARRGAHVTILARDLRKLNGAKQEIVQECVLPTQTIAVLSVDLCSGYEQIERALLSAQQDSGPVFMLINCAGKAICGKLEDLTPQHISELNALNYLGSVYAARAVVEGMKSRGAGHIVFISSEAGLLGIYGFTAYSPTKFALRGLAEALNMETYCYGVKVTVAFPPDTDTPGFAQEEIGKPKETKLICETSGLYKPSIVANVIMTDTLAGRFLSSVGSDGFMLTTLCAGMSPFFSLVQLVTQVVLMGPFRLVSAFYLFTFYRIIKRCMQDRNKSKKPE